MTKGGLSNKSDRNKEEQSACVGRYPAANTYFEDTEKTNVWINLLCSSHRLDILSFYTDSVPYPSTRRTYLCLRLVDSEKDAPRFQEACVGSPLVVEG